jgi:hypothetical protein
VPTPDQTRACLTQLQGLIDEVQALLQFVDSGQALSRAGKEEARRRLTGLKMQLGSEAHRTSTTRQELSQVERDYYAPAVQSACSEIRVGSASAPGPRWCRDLYSAQVELSCVVPD